MKGNKSQRHSEKTVEDFAAKFTTEALVQCLECGDTELRKVGIGRAEELRCLNCKKGKVEVLKVYS